MLAAAPDLTDAVKDLLGASFSLDQFDGFWYPAERTDSMPALVRVIVGGGAYSIERRRSPDGPWMPVVTADVAEFDQAAFAQWRANWSMVANH